VPRFANDRVVLEKTSLITLDCCWKIPIALIDQQSKRVMASLEKSRITQCKQGLA
jgi:hypothetical protein